MSACIKKGNNRKDKKRDCCKRSSPSFLFSDVHQLRIQPLGIHALGAHVHQNVPVFYGKGHAPAVRVSRVVHPVCPGPDRFGRQILRQENGVIHDLMQFRRDRIRPGNGVQGKIVIANRIFETVFYNLFLTSQEIQQSDIWKASNREKQQFIEHGRLDMEKILERYISIFNEIYGNCEEKFKEEEGRKYFLLFLKPIINGTGNYYIEAHTRNNERTDIVIDYLGTQYIVELKIWRDKAYNKQGEEQLIDYLNHYHINKGYMLTYNFNKNKKYSQRSS